MTNNADQSRGNEPGMRYSTSIERIEASHWQALVGANSFSDYEWLRLLETTGDVSADTGWQPYHLALLDESSTPSALAPSYLKSHSWGEFVFDWVWQSAWERAGGRYYPKLVTTAPFTPVNGKRIFGSDDSTKELVVQTQEHLRELGVSGWHLLYCEDDLSSLGFVARTSIAYRWHNHGFKDFDEYLLTLRASKRKSIRRERREVAQDGLEFRTLVGSECTRDVLNDFYHCYANTYAIRGNLPYFSAETLLGMQRVFGDKLVLTSAWYGQSLVAGALFVHSNDCLHGRYWGSVVDIPYLHFELCYYGGMDYAIKRGIPRFDPGIQGQHKAKRGFVAELVQSWHWLAHDGFHDAVKQFCATEHEERAAERDYLVDMLPFKRG